MSSSPPRPPPPPPSAPSGASMRLVRTHFRPTSEVVTAAPQLQPQPPPAATDWRQEQHHHHQLPVHARSSLPPTSLPHQVSPYPIGSRYDSGPYPHGYGPMPSSSWPPLFGQGSGPRLMAPDDRTSGERHRDPAAQGHDGSVPVHASGSDWPHDTGYLPPDRADWPPYLAPGPPPPPPAPVRAMHFVRDRAPYDHNGHWEMPAAAGPMTHPEREGGSSHHWNWNGNGPWTGHFRPDHHHHHHHASYGHDQAMYYEAERADLRRPRHHRQSQSGGWPGGAPMSDQHQAATAAAYGPAAAAAAVPMAGRLGGDGGLYPGRECFRHHSLQDPYHPGRDYPAHYSSPPAPLPPPPPPGVDNRRPDHMSYSEPSLTVRDRCWSNARSGSEATSYSQQHQHQHMWDHRRDSATAAAAARFAASATSHRSPHLDVHDPVVSGREYDMRPPRPTILAPGRRDMDNGWREPYERESGPQPLPRSRDVPPKSPQDVPLPGASDPASPAVHVPRVSRKRRRSRDPTESQQRLLPPPPPPPTTPRRDSRRQYDGNGDLDVEDDNGEPESRHAAQSTSHVAAAAVDPVSTTDPDSSAEALPFLALRSGAQVRRTRSSAAAANGTGAAAKSKAAASGSDAVQKDYHVFTRGTYDLMVQYLELAAQTPLGPASPGSSRDRHPHLPRPGDPSQVGADCPWYPTRDEIIEASTGKALSRKRWKRLQDNLQLMASRPQYRKLSWKGCSLIIAPQEDWAAIVAEFHAQPGPNTNQLHQHHRGAKETLMMLCKNYQNRRSRCGITEVFVQEYVDGCDGCTADRSSSSSGGGDAGGLGGGGSSDDD